MIIHFSAYFVRDITILAETRYELNYEQFRSNPTVFYTELEVF